MGYPTKEEFTSSILKEEYVSFLDSKKRITVRHPQYDVYQVQEYSDGHLVFILCNIVRSEKIDKQTLNQIEKSVENMKSGKVLGPIDVKAVRKLYRK